MTRFSRWDRRVDRYAINLIYMNGRDLRNMRSLNKRQMKRRSGPRWWQRRLRIGR